MSLASNTFQAQSYLESGTDGRILETQKNSTSPPVSSVENGNNA